MGNKGDLQVVKAILGSRAEHDKHTLDTVIGVNTNNLNRIWKGEQYPIALIVSYSLLTVLEKGNRKKYIHFGTISIQNVMFISVSCLYGFIHSEMG